MNCIVTARKQVARLHGYYSITDAVAAGDVACIRAMDAAAAEALHAEIQPQPKGASMSLFTHWQAGRIENRHALLAALVDAGWPAGPAEGLVAAVEVTAVQAHVATLRRVPAAYRHWSDYELAVIHAAMATRDTILPMAASRELAVRLGRSVKSVRSQCERFLAERAERATRAAS